MVFNSLGFLLFFPLVAVVYFFLTMRVALRHKALSNTLSQFFLLAASLFFYGCWNPAYLGLIVISIIVTWTSGLLMEGRDVQKKRLILTGSLIINLGILFFFKYYHFAVDSVIFFAGNRITFPSLNVLLPVGISFYTFQALGYSIDVYYGRVKAERNFITYALFVTFFPQLVAGPIERTGNLLPQFKVNHEFDYDRITSGLRLAAWGMFKKVVIADRVAVYVNGVFGNPAVYSAASLALAVFLFAFQVYCDFSGYSDIAIGCARVLGFNLMNNFRQPFFSRSLAELWQRWHISLSTWLKDYLYIPLGGSRKGKSRQKINLLITFLISGLWHGAAWHFVVWGLLYGVFQVIGQSTLPFRNAIGRKVGLPEESRIRKVIQICITFTLFYFMLIFFRARSMTDVFLIMAKLAKFPAELAGYIRGLSQNGIVRTVRDAFQMGKDVAHPISGFGLTNLGFSMLFIGILLVNDILMRKTPEETMLKWKQPVLRWAGYSALLFAILLSWSAELSPFIYFAF
jgi:alginate O-acetyltransferase complex protein AlgI